MQTTVESQSRKIESYNTMNFNTGIESEKNAVVEESVYVLYSRGRLLEGVDYFQSLQEIAAHTRRCSQVVEESLLNGKRKKMRSSHSLKSLVKLEAKFKGIGLDVYIESESL